VGIATRAVAAAFVVTQLAIVRAGEIEEKARPAEEPAAADTPPPAAPPSRFRAVRAASPIAIDGRIDEPAWRDAPVFDAFILNEPTEGGPPSERTELRVVFDDRRVTFAFVCYDSRPDTINRSLARRDTEPGSDWVVVILDADHDRRSALRFFLNAGGVQADTLFYDDIQGTQNWDAAWDGAAALRPDGWSAEISVPLAVLGAVAGNDGPWGRGASFRRCVRCPPTSSSA